MNELPVKPADRRRWSGLVDAAQGLAIAEAARAANRPVLVITRDTQSAEQLRDELGFFLGGQTPTLRLPDWETLIYDSFSPHEDIISERLAVLNALPELRHGVIVAPATTLIMRLAPRQFVLGGSLTLRKGQKFDLATTRRRLQGAAYRAVETVIRHGEYAVRGAIMDIFPMGSDAPYRIDLFDDEIDTLRTFDPETQRSIAMIDSVELLPAREFPLTEDAIRQFQDAWFLRFQGDARECPVYRDVSQGIYPAGIEYYLPLFFEHMETLFDYLPGELLVFCDDLEASLERHWETARDRFENLRHDVQRPILPPEELLLRPDEMFAQLKRHPRIDYRAEPNDKRSEALPYSPPPKLAITERSASPLADIASFVDERTARLLIVAESEGRREAVDELFTRHGLATTLVSDWREFANGDASLGLAVAPLERGLLTRGEDPIAMLTEQQLFGERVLQRRRRDRERANVSEVAIRSLAEIEVGSPVVHLDHGVGRYQGLVTLAMDGKAHEFLALSYQDDDKLYVPVSSLHLISRYAGGDEAFAPLHRLGGDAWRKAKSRAAKQIRDVAAELLNIYARRQARQGFAHPEPDDDYRRFAASFPFEETPDQQTAIDGVVADMVNDKPMDRLICGDVGFGKTEVAMRAAFISVAAGKQVAVLVPTTLLARQHTETFKDRFANWPVQIDSISRFKTRGEQREVVERMKAGRIDIVIGTHALIQDGLQFANLGLVIIDEEHRFGVRQKERLKALRTEVDVLTLTATPIPRTLNMALGGMRDLSLITTPPARRLSIKTFVREYDDALVKEAVQRELMRGGQVYYLHNEVRTIEQTADRVQRLAPEATVVVGHGQMRERELEQIMSDFYHKRANLLVCTTIIETGIDIPNANTIIMERADKFGLAQVHQLRGRVGRSHHQAYAYLLTPHPSVLTESARKRLAAIADAEDLGAGFILATHDLEIRGAGELLGEEQTGNLQTIGFSLYMKMLDRTVSAIKEGKSPDLDRPLREGTEVNLHLPALIPEDYLPDVHTRLVLYMRISNAASEDELAELRVEMIDRFGALPEPCKALFKVTRLKLLAERLGITKVDAGGTGGRLEFDPERVVDPSAIVSLVQSEPGRYRLSQSNRLSFEEEMEDDETRFDKVEQLLGRLEVKRVA